jgi:glucose-6-phosphate isomerase
VRLAEARDLAGFLRRMAAGEAINATENRAALHIALRAEKPYRVGGRDVLPEVRRHARAHARTERSHPLRRLARQRRRKRSRRW